MILGNAKCYEERHRKWAAGREGVYGLRQHCQERSLWDCLNKVWDVKFFTALPCFYTGCVLMCWEGMMWCDMMSDMMWYVMWCDMICDMMWHGKMWCDVICDVMSFVMWYVMWYVMRYGKMWCDVICDVIHDVMWYVIRCDVGRCDVMSYVYWCVAKVWGRGSDLLSYGVSILVILGCDLHECFSVFALFRWDRMARGGWSWVFPFPKVGWALIKPQQVRCWWNSVSSGQASLRRTECSGVFQNGYLSPPPAESARGFFSDLHHENLMELLKLSKVWRFPHGWVPFRVVHSEPPAIHQLQFRVSYLSTGSHGSFCSSNLWFCYPLPVSPILGAVIFPATSILWQV